MYESIIDAASLAPAQQPSGMTTTTSEYGKVPRWMEGGSHCRSLLPNGMWGANGKWASNHWVFGASGARELTICQCGSVSRQAKI